MKERINSRTGLIKYGCILGRDVIGGMKLLCWSNHFNVSENLQTKDIRDIFGFVVCLFLFFWKGGGGVESRKKPEYRACHTCRPSDHD